MVTFIARAALAATVALLCLPCGAKLPPQSDTAKAQAAEASAKAAWTDKVALYKTCLAMDRVATAYRADLRRQGKNPPEPIATPACNDPGPYTQLTPIASKPLESSEAHSSPGAAVSPPSTNLPAARGTK